jgi:ataxin-3
MKAEQAYAQRQLWADEENQGARADSEEEMIRRAIEESEASARLEGHGTATGSGGPVGTDMEDVVQSRPSHFAQERVYDDDDAELREL